VTKQDFLTYCLHTYGTMPDYPFEDLFETAVLRHAEEDGVSLYAQVKPYASITNAKEVFVITSFDGQWDITDDESLAIDKMYLEHQNKKKAQEEAELAESSEEE